MQVFEHTVAPVSGYIESFTMSIGELVADCVHLQKVRMLAVVVAVLVGDLGLNETFHYGARVKVFPCYNCESH